MPELNAAVTPVAKNKVLVASTGMTRLDNSTSVGGYSNIDTSNRFASYDDYEIATPHASTSVAKLRLTLTKGMHFAGGTKSLRKDFDTWSSRVNFTSQVHAIARGVCLRGTYLGIGQGNAEDFTIEPLLMSETTVLPKGIKPKSKPKTVMKPPLESVIINESDEATRQTFEFSKVIYGSLNAYDRKQKDILGRDTYGIYGTSLMEPIIQTIRHLISINRGYVLFVEKYGNGRYVFNFDLLEKLIEEEIITVEDGQAIIDAWMEDHKYLKANEDIVGAGLSVTAIDANGSLDVMAFKKALETDIQIAFFQSSLSMGDSKGSTYAAGYVSEEDRMVVLEGMQAVIRNIAQQAINQRLALMGKQPDTITIQFEELSTPKIEFGDLQEAYNSGAINKATYEKVLRERFEIEIVADTEGGGSE